MARQRQRGIIMTLLWLVSLLALVSYSTAAEAASLTAQAVIGTVETSSDGQTWGTLTEGMVLNAGYHVRTSEDGSVGLQGDDGSILYLYGNSQLAIQDLVFSEAKQTRISRFKLFMGSLFAGAEKLAFKEDTFEVSTDLVIAGMKASSQQIDHDPNMNETYVTCLAGACYLQRTGQRGTVYTGANFQHEGSDIGEGAFFEIPPENTDIIDLIVHPEQALIGITSKGLLTPMNIGTGNLRGMTIDNKEGSPPIELNFPNGENVPLEGDDGLTAMIAPASEIGLSMSPAGVDMIVEFFEDLAEDDFMLIWEECDCASAAWGQMSIK